ncbi:hypothetical protein D3C72_1798180 [compost metagenome]
MVVVDDAAVAQEPQSQQPAASVEHHIGGFIAPARPNGRKLQQTGGGDGVRQLRNVIVRRLAMAEVLGGDVEIAEAHDDLTARRRSRRRSWSRRGGGS